MRIFLLFLHETWKIKEKIFFGLIFIGKAWRCLKNTVGDPKRCPRVSKVIIGKNRMKTFLWSQMSSTKKCRTTKGRVPVESWFPGLQSLEGPLSFKNGVLKKIIRSHWRRAPESKKKIDPEAEVKLSNGSTDGGKSYVVWILKPKL